MSIENLKLPALLRHQAYVNGQWIDSQDAWPVRNPADDSPLGTVPMLDKDQIEQAIDQASSAFASWKKSSVITRQKLLRAWADLVEENKEDLARILSAEQGKPVKEAMGEISYAASFIYWYADEARRMYGETMPTASEAQRFHVIKQPVGVVAAITPWNFPAAMITRKAAPALAAGCTFIVKPAMETPFTALALAELAHQAGIPKGVFNVVTGDARLIAGAFMDSFTVRKITFTGSTEVGKILIRQSADTVKRISMELGGNAPFIIFEDADLDQAVTGLIASKFRNAGQTCVCANRIFVQRSIAKAFSEKFIAAVKALKVGPGSKDDTDIGPMIDDQAVEKIKEHIQDAREKGAELLFGGDQLNIGPRYLSPAVLLNVTEDMRCFTEESFGPIAPLILFDEEQEAIDGANNTRSGLASYFYTQNLARTVRVSEALEFGMVGVNVGVMSNDFAPFGGVKESGLGRESSHHGLEEYLEMKTVCLGGL